ncbi:MAG: 50S ribosomal protein L30 [Eubacteriales bacterium]|nr:50S ribosomal protein L30 [Eubacteriales bacterium]
MSKIKVTQVRSKSGLQKKALLTLEALGLGKIDRSNVFEDSPAIRGMVKKVAHIVKVEELAGGEE